MEKLNRFKIVIPSFNNQEWVEANIASIVNQTYTNYEVLYIDDASTDETAAKVTKIINDYDLKNNWKMVSNDVNQKRGFNVSPYNLNITNFMDDDEDILVFVDGDDWLVDDQVLENLNAYYNKHQPWMTYGGMYCYPSGDIANPQNTPYSDEVHKHNLYRKDHWRASHLRSFKWHLYKQIKEKDMLYSKTGKYYFHAEDLATSFPCLEMCPQHKIGVVDFPTYMFNATPSNRERGVQREADAGEALESEIRHQKPYKTLHEPLQSKDLFKWNRFDLPIKTMFLKDCNRGIAFGEELYKEHLRLWNGFKEYNNPDKNTYEKFRDAFLQMESDMRNGDFDWKRSPIVIDSHNHLLNGSHRTAASAFVNTHAEFEVGVDVKDGQKVCDYKMFRELGLSEDYMDAAALEMVRHNKNLLMVSLFPSANHSRDIDHILNKYGNIAYKKDVHLNKNGAFNYTLQLYKGEAWAGDWHNNFAGFRDKARLCFTNDNPMTIYLVEFDDLTQARSAKEDVRSIYNIGNHSVHINDTHEETLRLSRCVLNKNSINFLNHCNMKPYHKFLQQLNYYENYIVNNGLDFEDYCISASSVLSLYGLREGNDLDYLHTDSKEIQGHPDIHSHNSYGIGRYTKKIKEIVHDPNNHFYYGNLKVASLDVVKALKVARWEEKDKVDVELINSIV
jgi:glycosyltransferase involved in cell wall biosynthesis|tara:strand:+ start:353 stop:2374 length:2022 start_codon:yes stop_codon:yes gene_type:complete